MLQSNKEEERGTRQVLGAPLELLKYVDKVRLEIRKVYVRRPGKGNSNSHGARPVHLIIILMKWIRTSRLSKKNSLSTLGERLGLGFKV